MSRHTRTLLLAGASFLALGAFSYAGSGPAAPIVIAQADTGAVAAAQQAVAAARANLETAKKADKGIKKAQKALDDALAQLDSAKAAAAPPAPPTEEVVEELAEEAPAVVEEAVEQPPAEMVEEPAPEPLDPNVAEEASQEPPEAEVVKEPTAKPPKQQTAEEPAPTPPAAEVVEEPAPKPPAPDVAEEAPQEPPEAEVVKEPRAKPPKQQTAEEPAAKPPVADAETPKAEKAVRAKKPEGPRKGPPPERAEKPSDKPTKPLPESAEAIKEGQKVEAAGGRTIEKEKGRVVIRHEDEDRFASKDSKVERRRGNDGRTVITVERPNGETIVTVRDENGDIVKRTRETRDGREVVLIDNERRGRRNEPPRFDLGSLLPPIVINIPRQDYVVESQRASPQMLFQTLVAPPVEAVERSYTLEEVRYNERLRDKVRRVDVDTVTFEFGQAYVPESQIDQLDGIARAIQAAIQRDEREVFLLEGHTDAVGSEIANLALSDRRAESVAEILTYYYDIPPENLITQGYGEAYLKVPTPAAERQNRRVTLRRITPLLNAEG